MTVVRGDPDWDDHHDKPTEAEVRRRFRRETNDFLWWVAMVALTVALGLQAALRWATS